VLAANGSPRTRRWRRIVWFALLVVFLCVGAAFVYRFYHGRDLRYCRRGQLYLDHGNTNEALQQFRAALKLNPKLMQAQVGIVQALVLRKEFPEALVEVNKAVEDGLAESETALLKARVFRDRANNRFETAGKALTVEVCEQTVAEDVDPAIALVQQQAEKAQKPAAAYTLLGDLFGQKLQIERAQERLLVKAYKSARDLDKKDEMAAREQDIRALFLKMRSVRELSHQAYEEAIRKNPDAADPRIALAREALHAYNPRTGEAEAILEPLLKLTPPPREALHLTAIAEWYSGDLDRALKHMRLLNNMAEPRREYLVTEAEILIAHDRWPEARAVAEKLEEIGPKRPEVRWIMGRVLLHEGRADEALERLQNIFSSPRTWAQARLALAQALMRANPPKREQAVSQYGKVLDDYKVTTPLNARTEKELREAAYQAYVALAGAEREVGPKAAQEYAVRALGIAPERPEAFQLAHDMCKAAGVAPEKLEALALFHARGMARDPAQWNAANEFLRKEYEEFKDTPGKGARVRLLRANLLEKMGAYLEAVAAYEEIRKEFPKAAVVAYELAQLHVQLGHYEEARKVYESVLAAYPADLRAVVGLVGVFLRLKDMAGADAVLDRAAGASNSAKVWATMLNIFLREKRLDEAVSLAKSYVGKNPGSAPAECMLAEVLWAQGDLKGAKSAFDETLKLAPDFQPAVRRALLDIEENRAADAVTLLRAAADKLRTDSAKADLAVALQANGKPQEAADVLKGLSASAQGPLVQLDPVRWYLAVLLAGEGDLKGAGAMSDLLAAREYLGLPADRLELLQRVAAAAEPGRRDLAAKLNVVVWLSMNVCPGALEQADLLVKQLPDEPLTACWRARLLDTAGKHDEAARQCRDILSAHPGFVMARLLLAGSQQRDGKTDEAIKSLDEALNEAPPELAGGVQLQRAQLLEESGRLEEAIAAYQAITAPPALAAAACNELAWLYVTKRNDADSALPIAEQAAQLSPNDPAILDTLGWVLCMKGENDRALEALLKARSGLPGNPTVRYHLGLAFLKVGRKDDARAELEEALAISKDFPEAADAAAQLAGI
jgi:tetratricopeptide (TPR) repeat protein